MIAEVGNLGGEGGVLSITYQNSSSSKPAISKHFKLPLYSSAADTFSILGNGRHDYDHAHGPKCRVRGRHGSMSKMCMVPS
jgi:hypothetical protein